MPPRTRFPVACEECGTMFLVRPSRRKEGNGRFCSRACYWNYNRREGFNTQQTLNKIFAVCVTCGVSFPIKPSYIKKGRGRFCSQQCFGLSRRGTTWKQTKPHVRSTPLQRVDLVCQRCGITFQGFPFEVGQRKYCSIQCTWVWRPQLYCHCHWCGIDVAVYRYRAKQPRVFCSSVCVGEWTSHYQRGAVHPMWKGGLTPFTYAKEFHRKRKSILARDNSTCQVCGVVKKNRMAVHHIDEDPTNHDDNNLVTVCPTCHRGVIHGTNEVTFDSQRRPVWKQRERWPKRAGEKSA